MPGNLVSHIKQDGQLTPIVTPGFTQNVHANLSGLGYEESGHSGFATAEQGALAETAIQTETDPIYNSDKPNIALKAEVQAEADRAMQAEGNIVEILNGIKAIQISSVSLARSIYDDLVGTGTTIIPRSVLGVGQSIIPFSTLVTDVPNGTIGVVASFTESEVTVRTLAISPISTNEPTLVGNVNTNNGSAGLPQTLTDADAVFGRTPRISDYAKTISDTNVVIEWYVSNIDTDGNITWGNPITINTSDYQTQLTASDAGKIPIGGSTPGQWGESLELDSIPVENSRNLMSSGDIYSRFSNVDNTSDINKPVSTATQTVLNEKLSKTGDTMTGTLVGANKVGANISTFTTNTAFTVPRNTTQSSGQGVFSWLTAGGNGYSLISPGAVGGGDISSLLYAKKEDIDNNTGQNIKLVAALTDGNFNIVKGSVPKLSNVLNLGASVNINPFTIPDIMPNVGDHIPFICNSDAVGLPWVNTTAGTMIYTSNMTCNMIITRGGNTLQVAIKQYYRPNTTSAGTWGNWLQLIKSITIAGITKTPDSNGNVNFTVDELKTALGIT